MFEIVSWIAKNKMVTNSKEKSDMSSRQSGGYVDPVFPLKFSPHTAELTRVLLKQ